MVRGVLDKAEIHRMAHSKDECVRSEIADEIGSAFPYLTDREQAWKDLLALAKDDYIDVKRSAVRALGSAFPS